MASVEKRTLMSRALTATANGDSVGLELGYGSFIAHLAVSAINAATTVNAKIQHSPDGSNWYDVESFAAVAGSAATEAKAITGPLFPQVRAVATLTGVTQAATVAVDLFMDKN